LEEFEDVLVSESRWNEDDIPLEEVKEELVRRGKL
jgi:hypothetical protein